MTRGKGLDDLLLFGGQPRARARTFLPEGFNQSRTPCRVAVPGPTSSGLTLGEARARVAKTIERFVRDRGANAGRALVVRARKRPLASCAVVMVRVVVALPSQPVTVVAYLLPKTS